MTEPQFIVIEGIDGSGKTYLAKRITDWLNANEKDSAICTSEPCYRATVKEDVEIIGDYRPHPYYKDRIIHYAYIICPALDLGKHVVCDRFQLSTCVYQAELETLFTPIYAEYGFYVLQPNIWKKISESEHGICKDPSWLILIDPDIKDAANRIWARGEEVNTKDLAWQKEKFVKLLGDFYRNSMAYLTGDVNIIRARTADEAFEQFTERWNASSDDDSED